MPLNPHPTRAPESEIMATILAYRKRGLSAVLDEPYYAPAPLSKRPRCHETPPLARLRALFPDLEPQLIERVLEEFSNNVDSAIKGLKEIQSGSAEREADGSARETIAENLTIENLPTDGSGWVELFVREMMAASCLDDARVRASRLLELLEKSLVSHANTEAAQGFQKENDFLKEKMEGFVHENTVLKRGIAILHDRQKDYDARIQEIEQLKQTMSQYREQLKTLELNNYALAMHLKQAQQNSSIPGSFHPDVF